MSGSSSAEDRHVVDFGVGEAQQLHKRIAGWQGSGPDAVMQ